MTRRLLLPALMAVLGCCGATAAAAQPAPPPAPLENIRIVQDAEDVRQQLQQILQTYPRSVAEVLRRDPSLMARADYMAAYPQLLTFIEQHPEIRRNVEFYFEGYGSWGRQPYDPEFEALGAITRRTLGHRSGPLSGR